MFLLMEIDGVTGETVFAKKDYIYFNNLESKTNGIGPVMRIFTKSR
jgi:hypothetical protein